MVIPALVECPWWTECPDADLGLLAGTPAARWAGIAWFLRARDRGIEKGTTAWGGFADLEPIEAAARWACCSTRTVRRALAELAAAGVVVYVRGSAEEGTGRVAFLRTKGTPATVELARLHEQLRRTGPAPRRTGLSKRRSDLTGETLLSGRLSERLRETPPPPPAEQAAEPIEGGARPVAPEAGAPRAKNPPIPPAEGREGGVRPARAGRRTLADRRAAAGLPTGADTIRTLRAGSRAPETA